MVPPDTDPGVGVVEDVVNAVFRDAWNYTYLDNRGVPSGSGPRVLLAYSPRHTVNYVMTITPRPRWTIESTVRYEDSRYSGNDRTGTKMGSQIVADLRLAYQWRQMEVYAGISDINNKRYVEVPGYPLAGATAYWGIRLRLWG